VPKYHVSELLTISCIVFVAHFQKLLSNHLFKTFKQLFVFISCRENSNTYTLSGHSKIIFLLAYLLSATCVLKPCSVHIALFANVLTLACVSKFYFGIAKRTMAPLSL